MPADTTSGALRIKSVPSDLAAQEPSIFHVLCSRLGSSGRLEPAVRGPFEGTLGQATSHCRVVAHSIAGRFGVAACCDLRDASGAPVFSISCRPAAGGAA